MNHEALERACLAAWPAARRMRRFGWEHCATAGRSGRANAVWPLAWTDEAPLEQAIADAAAWCAAQGIAPTFKLSDGLTCPAHLPEALAAASYAPKTETVVMTTPVAPYPQRPNFVEFYNHANEYVWSPLSTSAPSPEDYAERIDIVGRITAPHVFALVRDEGAPGCSGMGVLSDDLLGIYLMRTAPWARRRGLGRQIVRALLHWGATHEARTAYLQVEAANAPAVALYANEGFTTAYRYRYWSKH